MEHEKGVYRYSYDGKMFLAYATSVSNFRDIMNRNSSWKRYSLPFLRGHTRFVGSIDGLNAMEREILRVNTEEGFGGIWLNKWLDFPQSFFQMFEKGFPDFKIMPRREFDKVRVPINMNRNIEMLKSKLNKIHSLSEVDDS